MVNQTKLILLTKKVLFNKIEFIKLLICGEIKMKKIILYSIIIFSLVFAAAAKGKIDRTLVESAASLCPLHNETTQIFSNADLPKDAEEKVAFYNASIESAGIVLTVWTKKKGWAQGTMARLVPGQKTKTTLKDDIEDYQFFALTSIDRKTYIYSFSTEGDDLLISVMDK